MFYIIDNSRYATFFFRNFEKITTDNMSPIKLKFIDKMAEVVINIMYHVWILTLYETVMFTERVLRFVLTLKCLQKYMILFLNDMNIGQSAH